MHENQKRSESGKDTGQTVGGKENPAAGKVPDLKAIMANAEKLKKDKMYCRPMNQKTKF